MHDFEMQIVVDNELRGEPAVTPEFRGREHFVVATFHGTENFVFDLLRREVHGVVSPETACNSSFWNHVVVPIMVGVLGCALDVIPLHAACLCRRGRGILLAGLSGAGKSTLAVALAQQGFELVSDDWTYVRVVNGAVEAHGLSVPVKLLPDAIEHFSMLKNETLSVAMNRELSYETEISRLGATGARVTRPDCLVFVERCDGQHSSFERIGPEAVREFFLRSGERLPSRLAVAHKNRIRAIAKVAECDAWLFRYGGKPQFGASIVQEFYEGRYGDDRCA